LSTGTLAANFPVMSTWELLTTNLLSPVVLAFVLGLVATLLKSDLKLPEQLYTSLSIYLLLAIGLKGGVALSHSSMGDIWRPAVVTVAMGSAVPLWCYLILRKLGKFSIADSAAVAAHYGSVSAVTFIASLAFAGAVGISVEGFMPALVALLEVPAIVIALLLATVLMGGNRPIGEVMHEVLTGRSIVLLLGGLAIGWIAGDTGWKQISPLFELPFRGVLMLFMLEMGMITATRLRDLRRVGLFLAVFGVVMPVINGAIGVWLGQLSGLSLGGATVLGTMAASASYIAAPAAVRIALPEANPGYYLAAALGVTFPFNIAIGIPLYYSLAKWMYA
jgi:uncharacterized protein